MCLCQASLFDIEYLSSFPLSMGVAISDMKRGIGMKIACVGGGYVGTVTAAAFASLGHRTTIIDIDVNKVNRINSGRSPVFEPGLDELVGRMAGKFLFATDRYDGIGEADVVFICVGTPSKANGTADLSYVRQAASSIGRMLNPSRYTVIVDKSTVPVGTADLVGSVMEEASGLLNGRSFAVVSNPEFLREGSALKDVFEADRIVVGTSDGRARRVMRRLYRKLQSSNAVYYETDSRTAELIKYASNAFLAIKVSYANEMARLCDALGADVTDLLQGVGMDSRIGNKFLEVSSGWSGTCFPKDLRELLLTGRNHGVELKLGEAAIASNMDMHRYCVQKVRRKLRTLNGKRLGILGLTFKPHTDDVRETQAVAIIADLLELGCDIRVHDPRGMDSFRKLHSHLQVRFCERPEEVAHRADAIILLTHWPEYDELNWSEMRRQTRFPYLLDTRNFLPPAKLRSLGFMYEGMGKSID